jgi:hypothetical protein
MDDQTLAVGTLSTATGTSLTDRMGEMRMDILLSEIVKQAENAKKDRDRKSRPGFSDAAMERVEASFCLRNRPGLNVTAAGDASVLTDSSHHTDGAASNRSVVTDDIQMRMPKLRLELNRLKSLLHNLSPEDSLFQDKIMKSTDFEDLSLNSSASAALAAFYKDTKKCITLLKICICELEHAPPPRRQVEAPSLPPQMREVVLRRRADRPLFPAFCLGYWQKEWGTMYPKRPWLEWY